MTAITVFNGLFCDADAVVEHVSEITGYRVVDDQEVIADAARLSGLGKNVISGIFQTGEGGWLENGAERNRIVSWLRLAMARRLVREENVIFWGYTAMLAPRDSENIFSVCLVNERNDRLWAACRDGAFSEAEAYERMAASDRVCGNWIVGVTECNDPWSGTLYDLVIPVGSLGVRQSAYLLVEQLANAMVRDTESSRKRMKDYLLAAEVQAELSRKGHNLSVSAQAGRLTLSLESHDATLQNATRSLYREVSALEGVRGVEIGTGQRYNPNDVFQRVPFAHPSLAGAAVEDAERSSVSVEDASLTNAIRGRYPYSEWGVSVFVDNGIVSLTVNNHRKMLERVSRRIVDQASACQGVESVEVGIGKEYHQGAHYARLRHEKCRALLADDKRKFVPTMSPRLQLANRMGSFALYDGKSAFYAMDEHEPEVVVLDMRTQDGAEALRRFKRDHPETEVLVLSGRGSEKEREACMTLGAFACLKKPVNTAALSDTIRAACEKHRSCSLPA